MTDGAVFGKAVDELYQETIHDDGFSRRCVQRAESPLFTVAANMMCQAAEEAIRKFSVDPTARNVGHSQ